MIFVRMVVLLSGVLLDFLCASVLFCAIYEYDTFFKCFFISFRPIVRSFVGSPLGLSFQWSASGLIGACNADICNCQSESLTVRREPVTVNRKLYPSPSQSGICHCQQGICSCQSGICNCQSESVTVSRNLYLPAGICNCHSESVTIKSECGSVFESVTVTRNLHLGRNL